MKVPYQLIIGEKEMAAGSVSVRYRGGKQVNGVPLEDFIKELHETVNSKAQV